MTNRIKIRFLNKEIEFIDRDVAIRQVEDLARIGTYPVYVIYGPEGCGKTAFFKQATEILREHGYSVVHVNPLARVLEDRLIVTDELRGLFNDALSVIPNPFNNALRLLDFAIELLYTAVKRNIKRKIALLADDIFQAIGLNKAEILVKSLLNMIEWPSIKYEKIVVLVASSEGITMERIGRHNWATFKTMWNMPRRGFEELHGQLPKGKMSLEDAWELTGGNPRILEELYIRNWNIDEVIRDLVKSRRLADKLASLNDTEREVLWSALEDPDALLRRIRDAPSLVNKLIELNLIIEVFDRDQSGWIDEPPPEKDTQLGIGKYYAWQTPLHREAVKRVLERGWS